MRRRSIHPLIKLVIFFGGIGIVYSLFNNPSEFMKRLLFMALMIGVVYFIFQAVMRRRMGKNHSSFMKAVSQSKKLHHERDKKNSTSSSVRAKTHQKSTRSSLQHKRKNNNHLTVIEGKKGKKKNRAFF